VFDELTLAKFGEDPTCVWGDDWLMVKLGKMPSLATDVLNLDSRKVVAKGKECTFDRVALAPQITYPVQPPTA
jgi:hypothetical protein